MKILILVLSADFPPYRKMIDTAMQTWDAVEVEDMETIYYCGNSGKANTDKIIYFPVNEGYFTMGAKFLMALEWVLANKEFDYIARVHSSIYVDKVRLKEYIQNLEAPIFAGVETDSQNSFRYCWGGTGYILSRDVAQRIVENKTIWDHRFMEDESLSLLIAKLSIPFSVLKAGAIDQIGDGWRCISYNGESISFTDFAELKRLNHHYFRVKQDRKRDRDEFIMRELFKVLN